MNAARDRTLILSGSAGHGHVMAGRAITEALRRRHPHLDVAHLDAVEHMSRPFARFYRWGYLRLVDKHPLLWRMLYHATDARSSRLGHAITVLSARRFVDAVHRWRPKVIVCTHFLALEVLSREKRLGRLDAELHAVITDHDTHRMWIWPEVSHYYVGSSIVAARLATGHGVPAARILETGIPVRRAFQARPDPAPVRAAHGLDPARPTVVFLSGGFAAGPMAQSILGLWLERRDVQVLALCGRNERLRRRIDALPRPTGAVLRALGFQEDVAPILAAADVVVSKSGGISTSECMALGKPLVIPHAIAGQEERNALWVTAGGAGIYAPSAAEVRHHVGRLLADPAARQRMGERARFLGRPEAARTIADHVAETVDPPREAARPRFHGAL